MFNSKYKWQPPQGHLCIDVFLSQVENELFESPKADIKYSNLSREEWTAITSLADDRHIIIKKADKGLCIVIWGRNHYLIEAEKHLSDKKVCQEVSNSENILSKLAEMSNKMFSNSKKRGYITELRGYINNLNIFPMNIETLANFISFSKFIKCCTRSQVGQSFRFAVHL